MDELADWQGGVIPTRLPNPQPAVSLPRSRFVQRRRGSGAKRGSGSNLSGRVALLAMALSSGSTIQGAIELLAELGTDDEVRPWRTAAARLRHGADLRSALEIAELDGTPDFQRVARTVERASFDGVALSDQLRALAADLHRERVHRMELAANRLSITLLFPLITCVLPAFALLTLAPMVIAIFDGIGL